MFLNALMGIDVGSTTIKAAIYGLDGRLISLETRPSAVLRDQPGWSEQDMADVWKLVRLCIVGALQRAPDVSISAIGVCGQGDGLWALDAACKPVRNAILWNDSRGENLVLGWIGDGTAARLSRHSRTSNWAGTAGTAFRWLKEHEPANAARVAHVLFCKDWINLQLTGNLATDFSDASIPFLDLETRRYADEAFDLLGVPELKGKLVPAQRATDRHGSLLPEVAAELGLPAGIPVATGAIDLGAMMSAMHLDHTGDVGLVLGTTAMVNVVIDPEPFDGEPVGATLAHPFNGRWIRVIAPLSGASAFDWFTSLHPRSLGGADIVEVAAKMNGLIRQVPPGANGVTFLPYLSGERAPFVAPQASASFHGLRASTTTADMARAVMEGASFSLKHCFHATHIKSPGQVFLTGGGARNHLWCDILASVLGTTIMASDASDHGVWGAALLGAAAAGLRDVDTAPPRDEASRMHPPDPGLAACYDRLYEHYLVAIDASRPVWDSARAQAAFPQVPNQQEP